MSIAYKAGFWWSSGVNTLKPGTYKFFYNLLV